MSPQAWFLLYMRLHFCFVGVKSLADDSIIYGSVGGTTVFSPRHNVTRISSLIWKVGLDLAMEWFGKEVYAYRHFTDFGALNTRTGQMTLTGLRPTDSDRYTVIINNIDVSHFELRVLFNVSKPTLSVSCYSNDKCLLSCNGNMSGVVSVYWDFDGNLTKLPSKIYITKKNLEQSFACVYGNPVSSIRSDPVQNPFRRHRYSICCPVLLNIAIVLYIVIRFSGRQRRLANGNEYTRTVTVI